MSGYYMKPEYNEPPRFNSGMSPPGQATMARMDDHGMYMRQTGPPPMHMPNIPPHSDPFMRGSSPISGMNAQAYTRFCPIKGQQMNMRGEYMGSPQAGPPPYMPRHMSAQEYPAQRSQPSLMHPQHYPRQPPRSPSPSQDASPASRSPMASGGISERDKHICPKCKKPFPNQSSLNKHLTSHSEDRPYECSDCHKKFKRLDHLNSHSLTHKGIKPYPCPVVDCQKRYSDPRSLRRHKEKHHMYDSGQLKEMIEKGAVAVATSDEDGGDATGKGRGDEGQGKDDSSSREASDYESESDAEEPKPCMREGSQYQAEVQPMRDVRVTETMQSTLLWDLSDKLPEHVVDEYCQVCTSGLVCNGEGVSIPYALQVLQDANYNLEVALKTILSPKRSRDPWKAAEWSDEEKQAFEEGFAAHGKHFHLVARQIGTKTTGETIAFYYKWKKLENSRYRHLLAHQRRGGNTILDPTIYPHGELLDIDAEADLNSKESKEHDCSHCHVKRTSVWRRTRNGKVLCNQCGLGYARYGELRKQRPAALRESVTEDDVGEDINDMSGDDDSDAEMQHILKQHTVNTTALKTCAACHTGQSRMWHKAHHLGVLCVDCHRVYAERRVIEYPI